jgi:hypothetical protein
MQALRETSQTTSVAQYVPFNLHFHIATWSLAGQSAIIHFILSLHATYARIQGAQENILT